MPGDVESLDAARRARSSGLHEAAHASAAAGYVRRAEDALALLPVLDDLADRDAVCLITEAWLSLAEAALSKRD